MSNSFRVTEEQVNPPVPKEQVVKELFRKAEEFLDGMMLETGIRLDHAAMHTLKLALLEDFIEVHNASRKHPAPLPEDKASVLKLLG